VGEDRTGRPGAKVRGVTVSEAAQALGITAEAVRMRIKRGTLRSEKRGGRVHVLLGPDPTTEPTGDQTPDHTAELIATLREQLAAEREANRENRRIIAALTSRIPAIEAPSDERESAETVEEGPDRAEPRPATGGAQKGARRPWWRRVFGG
jgi:hypothetical protein